MVKRQKPRVRKKPTRSVNRSSRGRNATQLNMLTSNINSAMNKAYTQIYNIARLVDEMENNPDVDEVDLVKARTSVAILFEKADKIKEDIMSEVNVCRTAFNTQPHDNISLEVINFTSKVDDWAGTSYTGLVEDLEAALAYIKNIIGDNK